MAHFAAETEEDCLRRSASCSPSSPRTTSTTRPPSSGDPADRADVALARSSLRIRVSRTHPPGYRLVVDDGYFFEVQKHFARNLVIGFARLGGRPVGSSPTTGVPRGVLDIDATSRGRASSAAGDCFQHPDRNLRGPSPASCPASVRRRRHHPARGQALYPRRGDGAEDHGRTRKAYAGAYCVMGSKHIRTDINFAYPHRRDRGHGRGGRCRDPLPSRDRRGRGPGSRRQAKLAEYRDKFASPYAAAEPRLRRRVIEPRFPRLKLIRALACSRTRATPTRHGNTATSPFNISNLKSEVSRS